MRAATALLIAVCLVLALAPASALAEGRVRLELVTESGFPALETQKWYRLFTDLGVDGLTIRGARATDKAEVITEGEGANRVYRVIGVLTGRNELIVPGGRFTSRDAGRISAWLTKLQEEGPDGGKPAADTPFGLAPEQLDEVRRELAVPVDFPTRDVPTADVVEALIENIGLKVTLGRGARAALSEADPVSEDLQGLACGTALAHVLRPAGLGFTPLLESSRFRLEVAEPQPGQMVWPVGLPAEDDRDTILPKVMEFLEVELDDVPLPQVLDAIGGRLETPMLLDHLALAIRKIDPAKSVVSLPAKRTTYSLALRKALGQAKLKSSLRVDDADKPFFWITTMVPAE
jgi:hypothetical protein